MSDTAPERPLNRQMLLRLGFTSILLGYLMVWLPHKAAGLSFIGLELGEWVKFLPQVRSGEIAIDRNLFYLPPIILGLLLALWTVDWSNDRWQTWAMRAVAIVVAMLAFPAVEAILEEGSDQWLSRVIMILLVAVVAVLVAFLDRLPKEQGVAVSWSAMLVLALLGLVLPAWAYLTVRPAVIQLFAQNVGFGAGFWLNGIGHLLVAAVMLTLLLERRRSRHNQSR